MQIFTDFAQVNISGDSSLVIGKFLGLHLGHRLLVREMVKKGRDLNRCVLMIRNPGVSDLVPLEQVKKKLEKMGVDYLLILNLTPEVMSVPAEAFLSEILIGKFHMKEMVAGPDVTFGCKARGNEAFLRENQGKYEYNLTIIPKLTYDGEVISSTRIQKCLEAGEQISAEIMLGERVNTLTGMEPEGLLIIDKPAGFTSQDVISKLRGMLHTKKLGHTGTLDPEATGVLPVLVGRATKLSDLLMSQEKVYETTFKLGITTDTQDIWGKVISENNADVTREQIVKACTRFTGELSQLPPMYSAIKINGQKLYDLARAGKTVERTPRTITIYSIEITEIDLPCVSLKVACSKGTYIRTLCSDIGDYLGCGAAMTGLRRLSSGEFKIENSVSLEKLQEILDDGRPIDEWMISLDEILENYPKFTVFPEHDKAVHNGNEIDFSWGSGLAGPGLVCVYDSEGTLMGLFSDKNGGLKPEIMLKTVKEAPVSVKQR